MNIKRYEINTDPEEGCDGQPKLMPHEEGEACRWDAVAGLLASHDEQKKRIARLEELLARSICLNPVNPYAVVSWMTSDETIWNEDGLILSREAVKALKV